MLKINNLKVGRSSVQLSCNSAAFRGSVCVSESLLCGTTVISLHERQWIRATYIYFGSL